MKANVLKRGHVRISNDCAVDMVAATLAFSRSDKIDSTASGRVGWHVFDFADAATIFFLEWQANSSKRRFRGTTLPGAAHAKVALRYVEEFNNADMS